MGKIKKKDLLALCEAVMDSKIGLNKEAVYRGDDDITYRACSIYREFGGKTAAYLAMADKMDKAKEREYVEVEEDAANDIAFPGIGTTIASPAVYPDEKDLPHKGVPGACPNCGRSHYTLDAGTMTCVYYPPYIAEDGAIKANEDKNSRTWRKHCLDCGYEWEG